MLFSVYNDMLSVNIIVQIATHQNIHEKSRGLHLWLLTGTFALKNFRSRERKFMELSLSGAKMSWNFSFLGTKMTWKRRFSTLITEPAACCLGVRSVRM